jgi:hypothetical protein
MRNPFGKTISYGSAALGIVQTSLHVDLRQRKGGRQTEEYSDGHTHDSEEVAANPVDQGRKPRRGRLPGRIRLAEPDDQDGKMAKAAKAHRRRH